MIILTIFITLLFSSGINFCMEGNKLISYEAQLKRLCLEKNAKFGHENQEEIIQNSLNNEKHNQIDNKKSILETNCQTKAEEKFSSEKLAQLQNERVFSETERIRGEMFNPRKQSCLPKILRERIERFKNNLFIQMAVSAYTKPTSHDPIASMLRFLGLSVISIIIIYPISFAGSYLLQKYGSDSISPALAPAFSVGLFGTHLAYTFGALFEKC
ncbi:MAG: hypothetical protein WDZ41_03675 [Candidatus Babeliales bacterium]